jgi:hypothetical protein
MNGRRRGSECGLFCCVSDACVCKREESETLGFLIYVLHTYGRLISFRLNLF